MKTLVLALLFGASTAAWSQSAEIANPDPLVEARVRQLRAKGRNPFDDYFVAEAAVSLKHGAGRLIRTETDRGLLVLCDPRLRQMAYGRRLLAALPPMGRLGEEDQALDWLAELAAGH